MPQIKPLSEFNRNQNALIEDLSHSGEPLYLTRNGSACVVVMDSAAFDAAMAFRNEIYEQEMRTYRGMLKGIQEMQEGKLHDAQDVMDELPGTQGLGVMAAEGMRVLFTDSVRTFILENVFSERVALAIDRQRDMLALFPEMGREYDPVYDAARLSIPCRWIAIPDTPFTIYYVIDYDADEVRVFYIEHQRMNPMGRFS